MSTVDDDDNNAGGMTIVLQTLMFRQTEIYSFLFMHETVKCNP